MTERLPNNEQVREIREIIDYAASKQCPRPELINPNDIAEGQYPRGIRGKPAQAIVEINPATCAGGGPTTWAINNSAWAEQTAQIQMIPLLRVSRSLTVPRFVVPELTGYLVTTPNIEIGEPTDNSIPASFQPIETAVYQATKQLAEQKIERIFYLATGYTAQSPLAAAKAILRIKRELNCPELAGRFVYQDSCVPDYDNPSWNLDINGRPLDRFFPPAYAGLPNQGLETFAACVNWLPCPPTAEADRLQAYPGLKRLTVAQNFTPDYIQRLQDFYKGLTVSEARRLIQAYGLDILSNGNPNVVCPACGDYWNQENVGKWLTPEQFQSILAGTQTLALGVLEASRQIGRSINLVLPAEAIEFLLSKKIEGVFTPDQNPTTSGILIVPKPELPQTVLLAVYKLSQLIINRTSETNASAEVAILPDIPQILFTIPGFGYMGVDTIDSVINEFSTQWNFRYNDPPPLLAKVIAWMIQDPRYARQSCQKASEIFQMTYQDPGRNFFNVLNYLAGFNTKGER
ncbi:MAG TPA: hypothetical protein VMW41_03520 [Candidatus Bathyarchaeia archaeon]|nr:hypothetical protein [Candidatus Bathyarchaeia archaeon]